MNKNRFSQHIFLERSAMVKPKACRSLLLFLIHAALTLTFPITHAQAQIILDPDTIVFAPRQIHTTSEEKSFTIINTGQENLHISPDDIRLLAEGPQSTGLSVLTYNLWFDSDNWPARFVHMLREIRELDPDIIGLQEVIQRPHLDNQAKTLADSLGYYYYFSSRSAETADTRFGNAIVSRYPIEESNWRALNPLSDYRSAVHARIMVEDNIVDFYNTHLHNAAVNVHIRKEQIADLLNFIEETSSGGFILLTGDFNANPDWVEMDLMYEGFSDVYPLFHENHLDPEHGTLNHHLGHQQRRIDYIFFNKDKSQLLIPAAANVVLNTPSEAGVWGSDHFGVYARFNILSDADAFILHKLESATMLQPADSISLGVSFAPFTTGVKRARILAINNQIKLFGEAFDATIHDFPWEEYFDDLEQGRLPLGWETNAQNWGASPSATAGGTTPELLLDVTPQDQDTLVLLSPPINITGLDSLRLTFTQTLITADEEDPFLIKLYSYTDKQSYLLKQWSHPGDIPPGAVSITFNKNQHDGESIRLNWVFEGQPSGSVQWHLDDVVLHALPAMAVTPPDHRFEPQQINTTSEQLSFLLRNIGGGIIPLTPDDIRLSGNNPEEFLLTGISEPVLLSGTEVAEILVSFSPETPGEKQALLRIGNKEVPLSGQAFDPTIAALPWMEDFSGLSGGGLPLGWASNSEHWGAFNASHAGGEAPEMVFWWQPETTGRFYLITPEIITTELDSLELSFKHRIRNFRDPGKYTLSVIAIANGNEHLIHEWVDPDVVPAQEFITLLTAAAHGLQQAPYHLAWVFDGITDNIVQWDIDDIILTRLTQEAMPHIHPEQHDFGRQTIHTSSETAYFTLTNRGAKTLQLHASQVAINGQDAGDFLMEELPQQFSLATYETQEIGIRFHPRSEGEKNASLNINGITIPLTGRATAMVPYFVYSDFTISDNGRQYTNVDGFREVPAFARNGSLIANDIHNEGEFGGTVLQLAYNLALTENFTVYYMWAFPHADISGYDHIVIYARASEPVTNARLQLLDTSGVQGNDGGSYAWFNIGADWEKIIIPVAEMTKMPWADKHPDMSGIQRIDMIFEKNTTGPSNAIVYVDLVGFDLINVSANPVHNNDVTPSIYPNPAHNTVNIITDPGSTVSLIDITGRIIKTFQTIHDHHQLGISGLSPGVYLMQIVGPKSSKIEKFFVN